MSNLDTADLTLDEATDAFDNDPSAENAHALIAVAREYANDDMISEDEADSLIVSAMAALDTIASDNGQFGVGA